MKQRISIALATYNGEKYLTEQLFSYKEQTLQPDELIVSDDGSADSTVDIIKSFAKQVSFEVKVFAHETTQGYAHNFSYALQKCTGDLVFLSDQDDVWLPEKIAKVVAEFAVDTEAQLLIHDLDYCKEDLTRIGQTKIQRMRPIYDLSHKYVVGMATAVRQPFLDLCLPIPKIEGLTHDTWLHDCARSIGEKRIICEVLAMYRRHPFNVTHAEALNVDYVMTPAHLKAGAVKSKTVLPCAQQEALHAWLVKHRKVIIERKYTTVEQLEKVIAREAQRSTFLNARAEIHLLPRFKRPVSIFKLYGRGGYRFFSGWKSVAKDLFFN